MMMMLPFLLGHWKMLAMGALAVLIVGYVVVLRHQVAAARADRDQWQASALVYEAANKATVEAFDRYKVDQAAAMAAIELNQAATVKRLQAATKLRHEVDNAPAADGGSAAPVLDRLLDGIAAGNSDPGGARGAAGAAVGLPRRAAAAPATKP